MPTRRLTLTGLAAVALLGVLGAGPVTSGVAQPAAAPAPPRRIISLVPALTEMLYAIGAGPQVVAVSSFDTYPPEVAQLPRVGALLDPDVERMMSLTPDLVAIYGTQTDLKRQLARAAIPVFDYRHGGLADVFVTIRALGQRTGHGARASEVAGRIEQRIAAIRQRTSGQVRPRVLLVFGREIGSLRNIYASGGRGFLHDMLTAAGGVNALADIQREAVQATTELVLTRAPDVILEIHEDKAWTAATTAETIAIWGRLAAVPAVKDGRVHVLAGEGLVVPGPRVADAIERVARALHPETAR